MEEPPVEVLVESRKEAILYPSGEGEPITRGAFLLKPCIGGSSSPEPSPPRLSPLPEPFDPDKWHLSVQWKKPIRGWKPWVEKMQTLHEGTWRRAGIYEAVMGSTCEIVKDRDLVVGLSERWCPATKSFVFPWGEATVTLEDMAIVGGYSVLGCPVFSPLETEEMVAVQELLVESRKKMVRSSERKAVQSSWAREFKDGGSEIEHEAFLALWLSRYVLATIKAACDVILEKSFPIAVLLARGTRVALAPAVLAGIYNDLSLLKGKIAALTESEYNEEGVDDFAVRVRLPFQLVQVWAWERFVDLQPEPNAIRNNAALLAKWDKVKPVVKKGSIRLLLDTSKVKFRWRPYAKLVNHRSLPKVYAELGNQLVLSSDSDEDLLAFARFLRVSELVGMGCIEQYLPHRVAMQFGFDQDVPCRVRRCDRSPEIAWRCYNHPEKELMCQLPSRLNRAGVTARYLEWWQTSVGVHQSKYIRIRQQKKTAIQRMSTNSLKYKRKGNEAASSSVRSFDTTPGIKKVRRAGSSAKQDANGGAKRVNSFTITRKINKESRLASSVKRLKVPVGNTSREMKERPSTYFKGTTKTSNGPKHGRNYISSFKIKRKNSNTSATGREKGARVFPSCPGFLKASSDVAGSSQNFISSFKIKSKSSNTSATSREKGTQVSPSCPGFLKKSSDVAGSSRKHNENITPARRREEEAHVLPISTFLLRKSSDDPGMQNTSIPSPPRKTREDSSFKPERRKSLVRILLASQNLAQRLKRKRLENSKFDARAAARKIARTSAVVSKYRELKEIYKSSVPPGFQRKDLPGHNPVRCSASEARELPEAGQPTSPQVLQCSSSTRFERISEINTKSIRTEVEREASPRNIQPPITGVEIVDLEEAVEGIPGYNGEANAAELRHSKATTAIEIIDLEAIIDLEETAEQILGDNIASNSAREVGRSEVNADRLLPDNVDVLGPEMVARIRSLKTDFNRMIAEKMQQQQNGERM